MMLTHQDLVHDEPVSGNEHPGENNQNNKQNKEALSESAVKDNHPETNEELETVHVNDTPSKVDPGTDTKSGGTASASEEADETRENTKKSNQADGEGSEEVDQNDPAPVMTVSEMQKETDREDRALADEIISENNKSEQEKEVEEKKPEIQITGKKKDSKIPVTDQELPQPINKDITKPGNSTVAKETKQEKVTGLDDRSETSDIDVFDYSTLSREDLVERLKNLLDNQPVHQIKTDVDNIKLNFYKKLKAETEQKRKLFVDEGGNIEDFSPPEDQLEIEIKELFKKFREYKSQYNKKLEEEKRINLEYKYEVIEKLKDLINRKESINKTFQEFRELQKEWRTIGLVPQQNLKNLWDTYNYHIEKFYDYIKINKELRDLDLKKNLEAKIELCEKAEELLLEPSVVNAFQTLQKYHDQWREIGPVPAEMRTEVWARFKEATTKINRKHQQYFEDLKKTQKKNLEHKTLLCEKAEEISNLVLSTNKVWEEKSNELIELQKVWRTIGFAPKRNNNKIYMRFRTACDNFFDRKREFYTQNKEMQLNNLQLKTDLCVQAEALKESTEWRKTTEDLINLQKKWKEIGPIPKKNSDQIWKRFRAACDHFFKRKADYYKNIDKTFEDNLEQKEELIKEIERYKPGENLEENFKKLNEFQRKWTEIGFVPFKEKDVIQERYRKAINKQFDNLQIDDTKKTLLKFKNRLNNILQKQKAELKLRQEREKFVVRLQQLKNDIVLWENNIGFFTKSKNADSMIRDVRNKINKAKQTITILEAKIEMIDNLELDQQ